MEKTPLQINEEVERRQVIAAARIISGTIIETDEFKDAIGSARVTTKTVLPSVKMMVHSNNPNHNVCEGAIRLSATPFTLGMCNVSLASRIGTKRIRFEEVDTGRFIVVTKTVSGRWRVTSSNASPTGRRAGVRTRGHGPVRCTT